MSLNSKIQVPLPEKGVIVTKSGKYPYVFHVLETYRNAKGQPTNKRKSIGKLDATTGMLVPNEEYYRYYGENQLYAAVEPKLQGGEILEVGVPFMVSWILSSLDVDQVLTDSLGASKAAQVKLAASYMLAEGNVMSYLDDFCERTMAVGGMTDRDASRLFSSIGHAERMEFFKGWAALARRKEYVAYDVTSFSSYAKGIEDMEWGYNRDGDRLPQINLAMYVGQESQLPVFYTTYPGSIVDMAHLPYMMELNKELGVDGVCFVMDRGFASTRNLEHMCDMGYPFIMAMESRTKAFKTAIRERGNTVRTSRNHIDDLKVFGLAVKGRYFGASSTLHIFYDPELASAQTLDMYRKIASEEEELRQKSYLTKKEIKRYERYFEITKHEGSTGFTWERNFASIDLQANTLGYFCLLTSVDMTPMKILLIYKKRDKIEKSFNELKNHIEMKRLMTHKGETTDGKMFCAFICLIVRMHIENKLSEWMKGNRFTIERVVRELAKVRSVMGQAGGRLLNPLTKKQREILAAFGSTDSDVKKHIAADTR
jgi:transposase